MPVILSATSSTSGDASWSTASITHGVVAAGSFAVPGPVPPFAPVPVIVPGVLVGDVLSATIAVDDPGAPPASLVSIVGAIVVAPDTVQLITTGGIAAVATIDIVAFRTL